MNYLGEFNAAIKDGLEICKTTKEFLKTAKEITDGLHQTVNNLTQDAASVATTEANGFREAVRSANASGDAMMKRYEQLRSELSNYFNFARQFAQEGKVVNRDDVVQGNQIIRSVLLHAKTCFDNFPTFKEKLSKAVDAGTRLVEKCKVGCQDARNSSTSTRVVGYGVSGLAGTGAAGLLVGLAFGFLTLTTGGVGAAAVLTVGSLETAAYTKSRARRLDDLAKEFATLQGRLEADIQSLNALADKIEGRQEMTKVMVEQLRIKLQLALQEENGEAQVANGELMWR